MLGDYIAAALSRPWVWGSADCCTFMAGWVILRGNRDPMAFIRGTYDSEMGALRQIAAGGGLVPLWTRGMADAGVPEANHARVGDVGIIARPTQCSTDQAAAIFAGERWISLGMCGIQSGPADVLALWRP